MEKSPNTIMVMNPPNSISLAPFDKPEWIKRTEKHNRYKIVNFKGRKAAKGAPRNGKVMFVYDRGDALTIVRTSYIARLDAQNNISFHNSDNTIYRVKIKDGHAIIWRVRNTVTEQGGQALRQIRNWSNQIGSIKNAMFNFGKVNTYDRPWPTEEQIKKEEERRTAAVYVPLEATLSLDDLSAIRSSNFPYPEVVSSRPRHIKSAESRLNKVLVHFFKRNGIKFKYTKNPFENLRIACYLGSAGFELKEESILSAYSRHFLHGDIKYVIKKCFGYDSAKLVKLVCEKIIKDKSFNVMLLGIAIKKLVPLDYMYDLVNVDMSRLLRFRKPFHELTIKHVREVFKHYNAARLLKLIKAEDFSTYDFEDTVRMFSQMTEQQREQMPKKPKNWKEIHDAIMVHRPARAITLSPDVNAAEHYDLPVKDIYKEVDGAVVGDLKLEIPKNTKDLYAYSSKLKQCVWSYGPQVKNGSCDILAVYRGTELLYNISIYGKCMTHFRGVSNTDAPEPDRSLVVDFLKEKKVLEEPLVRKPNAIRVENILNV